MNFSRTFTPTALYLTSLPNARYGTLYLILGIKFLVSWIWYWIVWITVISAVLPINDSAGKLRGRGWLIWRVLVFGYSSPTNISTRVVDDPGWLEEASGRLKVLPFPEDAPVLQLGQTLRRIEGIDRAGEHQQLVLRQLLLHGKVVDV